MWNNEPKDKKALYECQSILLHMFNIILGFVIEYFFNIEMSCHIKYPNNVKSYNVYSDVYISLVRRANGINWLE